MKNKRFSQHEQWKTMHTDELDLVLQAELKKDNPNEEVVLSILSVLRERDQYAPTLINEEIVDYWNNIHEKHIVSQGKASRTKTTGHVKAQIWRKFAAIAAVVCLVATAVPAALGNDSIVTVIARWTDELFSFTDSEKDMNPGKYVFQSDNQDLQQVYEIIVEHGVVQPVVPMWLPEGFVLVESKTMETPIGKKLSFYFIKGKYSVLLIYSIPIQQSAQYEKAEGDAELYEVQGHKHYIVFNDQSWNALSVSSGTEYVITTNLNKEQLIRIIDSIYKE